MFARTRYLRQTRRLHGRRDDGERRVREGESGREREEREGGRGREGQRGGGIVVY